MFKIISDGGCDFSKEEEKILGVDIVPFYITFDQATHLKEGVDISKEDFFKRLMTEKKLFPKTAQPNPQDYIDVYTPHLKKGKDIISLTISSKLSGSYNSALMAADILKEEYPDRTIAIVDSLSCSVGQGLILKEMVKMCKSGFTLNETVSLAEEILKTTKVYFTLDSLEYLKRGGRVGPTTALVGGILGLRPILQLEDGQVSQLDNVRGKNRVLKLMEEAVVDVLKDEKQNISLSIGHIFNEKNAAAFKTNLEESLEIKITNPITEVGAAIGTHAGPGAMIFAYCKKYDAFAASRVA